MPNHVINEVRIHEFDDMLADAIRAKVVNADGYVDFELLLPPPINYWAGNAGVREEEAFPGTWLDWCADNWGTKWNAYGQSGVDDVPYRRENGVTILTFQTAWAPPLGWLCALFNTFKLRIEYSFLSEGSSRSRAGYFDWSALIGDDYSKRAWVEDAVADDAEHRRMHKLLWGVEELEDEATS